MFVATAPRPPTHSPERFSAPRSSPCRLRSPMFASLAKGSFSSSCSQDFIFSSVSRMLVSCVFLPDTRLTPTHYHSSPEALGSLLRTGRGIGRNQCLPLPSSAPALPSSVSFVPWAQEDNMFTSIGVQGASVSLLPLKWQDWKPCDFSCRVMVTFGLRTCFRSNI